MGGSVAHGGSPWESQAWPRSIYHLGVVIRTKDNGGGSGSGSLGKRGTELEAGFSTAEPWDNKLFKLENIIMTEVQNYF